MGDNKRPANDNGGERKKRNKSYYRSFSKGNAQVGHQFVLHMSLFGLLLRQPPLKPRPSFVLLDKKEAFYRVEVHSIKGALL